MNSQTDSPYHIILTEDQMNNVIAYVNGLMDARDKAQGLSLVTGKKVFVFESKFSYKSFTDLIETEYTDIPF